MLDNELIVLLSAVLVTGLATYEGLEDVEVIQFNQPTQQGVTTKRALYFSKITDRRYGWPERSDVFNEDDDTFNHTESQFYESDFQIKALALQNPAETTSLTASDLCNIASAILQSDESRKVFKDSGVGVLRITDVTNPYFFNDADNFEASPSFDITLTYKRVKTTQVAKVSEVQPGLYPI